MTDVQVKPPVQDDRASEREVIESHGIRPSKAVYPTPKEIKDAIESQKLMLENIRSEREQG